MILLCYVVNDESRLKWALERVVGDRNVSIVRQARTLGQGYNACVRQCTAPASPDDILVFLHQDVRLEFDWATKLPAYMAAFPNPGVLGVIGHHHYSRAWWGQWDYGRLLEGIGRCPREFRPCENRQGDLAWQPVEILDCVLLVVRRAVFDAVHGFDEGMVGWNFHDLDFCLRVKAAGYTNYVIQEQLWHLGGTLIGRGKPDEEWRAFARKWHALLSERG